MYAFITFCSCFYLLPCLPYLFDQIIKLCCCQIDTVLHSCLVYFQDSRSHFPNSSCILVWVLIIMLGLFSIMSTHTWDCSLLHFRLRLRQLSVSLLNFSSELFSLKYRLNNFFHRRSNIRISFETCLIQRSKTGRAFRLCQDSFSQFLTEEIISKIWDLFFVDNPTIFTNCRWKFSMLWWAFKVEGREILCSWIIQILSNLVKFFFLFTCSRFTFNFKVCIGLWIPSAAFVLNLS